MSLDSQFVATVYDRLFTDPELLSTDVKVYGVLWNRPGHSMRATARESGMPYETFRSAARRLVVTGWAYEVRLANGTAVIPWMPLGVEESSLLCSPHERRNTGGASGSCAASSTCFCATRRHR